VDVGEAVVAVVAPHPAVKSIELVGSRAEGRATRWSDWDFAVRAGDFRAVAEALPELLARFDPLVQQWDRLSSEQCWMLLLAGPVKVDLIFPDEPHEKEGPWKPGPETLAGIDDHFWDWMLWLKSKEVAVKSEQVALELDKLHGHLLAPLGVQQPPSSVAEAVASYRAARGRAEARFGRSVSRDVERAVAPALANGR
jgi:hypothetical protein